MSLTTSSGTHGQEFGSPGFIYYGEKGSIESGKIHLDDGSEQDALSVFEEEAPEDLKEKYFPKGIRNAFALEQLDFFDSIWNGRSPEVSGEEGLEDLIIAYAILESGEAERPVMIEEVRSGRCCAFQKEIDEYYS